MLISLMREWNTNWSALFADEDLKYDQLWYFRLGTNGVEKSIAAIRQRVVLSTLIDRK
jgi:hypothetical protein